MTTPSFSTRAAVIIRSMWARTTGRFALIVLALWVVLAIVASLWTPYALFDTDGYNVWSAPTGKHWLGTDGTGADVLSWLMAGSATDLIIVLITIAITIAFGLLLVTMVVSQTQALSVGFTVAIDALISIPTVLIALMLAVGLGASILVIVLACGFGYGLNLARVARSEALLAAKSDYVQAARMNGARGFSIMRRHIIPNIMPVLIVQSSLCAGTVLLAEASLTYLGIGVPSGVPSWGHSLSTSVRFISIHPMTVLWPGLCITLVVIALNLFGDALRDAADPLSNPQLRRLG